VRIAEQAIDLRHRKYFLSSSISAIESIKRPRYYCSFEFAIELGHAITVDTVVVRHIRSEWFFTIYS
jgi:hypothetical protein